MTNKVVRFTVTLLLILIVLIVLSIALNYFSNKLILNYSSFRRHQPPPGSGPGGAGIAGMGIGSEARDDRMLSDSYTGEMQDEQFSATSQSSEILEAKQSYAKLMKDTGKPTSDIMSRLSITETAAAYGRKLTVKNDLAMYVDSVEKTKEKVREIITNKGYIEASQYNIDNDGNPTAKLTIRVLAEYYPEVRTTIIKLGNVINEEEVIQDVTDQYYDLQSYLITREIYLNRLKSLLAAEKQLSNIISLTEMVTNIQGEINRYKEQLNLLAQQERFSTINLSLMQPIKVKTIKSNFIQTKKIQAPQFTWTQNQAIDEGIFILKTRLNALLNWIIFQVTANLFYWLLLVIVILVARHYIRKYKINILNLHKLNN